ncbi:MAG: hypothetical protein AAF471_04795 [Myxococcota bacterium]
MGHDKPRSGAGIHFGIVVGGHSREYLVVCAVLIETKHRQQDRRTMRYHFPLVFIAWLVGMCLPSGCADSNVGDVSQMATSPSKKEKKKTKIRKKCDEYGKRLQVRIERNKPHICTKIETDNSQGASKISWQFAPGPCKDMIGLWTILNPAGNGRVVSGIEKTF